MNKYNLAFIPKFKSKEFISLTEQYTDFHHNYILGKNSIPHVTVCQFYWEKEHLERLYDTVHAISLDYNLELAFKTWSHISFDGVIYWLSLLPEKPEKLHRIFNKVTQFIKPIRSDAYDPHLTLFNYSVSDNDLMQLSDTQFNVQDEFQLVIGHCDDIGQLTKIIKNF